MSRCSGSMCKTSNHILSQTVNQTIAAIASASGSAGVGIIRISGPDARRILHTLVRRPNGGAFTNRKLLYGFVYDGDEIVDEVLAVYMKAPFTYTTEDIAEIHCHGGRVTLERVLRLSLKEGARLALPGEFTRRAFEAGRIDLTRAEAALSLIGAEGEAAAHMAAKALTGEASRFVGEARDKLTHIIAGLQASIDFPDEVDEQDEAQAITNNIAALIRELRAAISGDTGRITMNGFDVVLIGKPNGGKSSIINALTRRDVAIVHETPGTTRDTITATLDIGGVIVSITDTAGLREPHDPVEMIGVNRAIDKASRADLLLYVIDASDEPQPLDDAFMTSDAAHKAIVLNKIDLRRGAVVATTRLYGDVEVVETCAIDNNVGAVTDYIAGILRSEVREDAIITMARHVEAASRAIAHMEAALLNAAAMDAMLIELMDALTCLCEITGEAANESIIDRVFADFCVGK